MADKKQEYKISNGPGKFDLMVALFDQNRVVSFETSGTDSPRQWVRILSVEAEDGSRESWNITGCYLGGAKFNAYFSTTSRKGTFRFV